MSGRAVGIAEVLLWVRVQNETSSKVFTGGWTTSLSTGFISLCFVGSVPGLFYFGKKNLQRFGCTNYILIYLK